MSRQLKIVAVIGSNQADRALDEMAERVGRTIAAAGYGLVCGGLGGVMEAACRGAHAILGGGSGRIIGILPGPHKEAANPYVDVAIPTGLGYARNILVVLSADAVIAVGGATGTMSEMAHAWQHGRPICAFVPAGGWGARLAGETLDDKRGDRVEAVETTEELATWLRQTLESSATQ
jgi:uncharacterized protein (TIGR00725 family)